MLVAYSSDMGRRPGQEPIAVCKLNGCHRNPILITSKNRICVKRFQTILKEIEVLKLMLNSLSSLADMHNKFLKDLDTPAPPRPAPPLSPNQVK